VRRKPVCFAAANCFLVLGTFGGCGFLPTIGRPLRVGGSPCVVFEEPLYLTSESLEQATNLAVRGNIRRIRFDRSDRIPAWRVQFSVQSQVGNLGDNRLSPYDIYINIPNLCGESPFSDNFRVGSQFVFLLFTIDNDGVFRIVNTAQGVIPVIDGHLEPLERSPQSNGRPVTISRELSTILGLG